jgi:hypothetical protein
MRKLVIPLFASPILLTLCVMSGFAASTAAPPTAGVGERYCYRESKPAAFQLSGNVSCVLRIVVRVTTEPLSVLSS